MLRFLPLLFVAIGSTGLVAQTRPDAGSDAPFYAVSYFEVTASSRAVASAALKQYRDAIRAQDGFVRIELFDQADRPGHFAMVETWRDQKAFDARGAAQKQLLDRLEPIRVSALDQRPYKTLAVGPAPGALNSRATYVVTHVDVAPPGTGIVELLKRLAEASRQDPGNLRFDVLQHTMRANHFTVIEGWESQKALDAHAAAAHTKQYREELQPLTGSPLDERVYKAIE
jgi:quinol monooxygenase YgiN